MFYSRATDIAMDLLKNSPSCAAAILFYGVENGAPFYSTEVEQAIRRLIAYGF